MVHDQIAGRAGPWAIGARQLHDESGFEHEPRPEGERDTRAGRVLGTETQPDAETRFNLLLREMVALRIDLTILKSRLEES